MNEWIPLLDYAVKTGLSLSTLRRHIKANKVPHKVENGRYLLQVQDLSAVSDLSVSNFSNAGAGATSGAVTALQNELQKAKEEIAELKTLIALYEEKPPQQRFNN